MLVMGTLKNDQLGQDQIIRLILVRTENLQSISFLKWRLGRFLQVCTSSILGKCYWFSFLPQFLLSNLNLSDNPKLMILEDSMQAMDYAGTVMLLLYSCYNWTFFELESLPMDRDRTVLYKRLSRDQRKDLTRGQEIRKGHFSKAKRKMTFFIES